MRRCVSACLRKVPYDLDQPKTDYENETEENDQRGQRMHALPSAQMPHMAQMEPLDANSVSWPGEHWQVSTTRVAIAPANLSAAPILLEPSRAAIIPNFSAVASWSSPGTPNDNAVRTQA